MSCHLRKRHVKNKRNQFRLKKNNYWCSQSRRLIYKVNTRFPSVKNWSAKYQEIQRKPFPFLPGRGRKGKISKTLERKLVRHVSEVPRTTATTLVHDLAKSRIVFPKKSITRTLHRNGLWACRPWKTPLDSTHAEETPLSQSEVR